MIRVRDDFNKRKSEIEVYVKYIKIFDDDDTKLSYNIEGVQEIKKIEQDFLTTLTANSFLLLYNIIESTIRNSVVEIYENIKDDEITFDHLSDKFKKLWTNFEIKPHINSESIKDFVIEFANRIKSNESVIFSEEWMSFSGNLDANEIRRLAAKMGFQTTSDGRNLVEIKEKRNRLAHGEQTFYDVGRNYSVNDINTLKNEVFNYLDDVIEKIGNFIDEKQYKV